MNLKKTMYSVMLVMSSFAQAQEFSAAYSIGGSSIDNTQSIQVDEDGNMFSTGTYKNTADMDPGPDNYDITSVSGSTDIYFQKLDADGNLIWAKSIGGLEDDLVRDIHLDVDGNIYLTGRYQGTCDFDPGMGTFELTSTGAMEIFTAKYNGEGELIWAVSMGGVNNDQGTKVITDPDNNVYTFGTYQLSGDFDPGPGTVELNTAFSLSNQLFMQKMNSSGVFQWVKQIDCSLLSSIEDVVLDDEGNFHIVGSFRGTGDFNPGPGTSTLVSNADGSWSTDPFVLKLDENFDFLWVKHLEGTGASSLASGIAIDGEGDVLFTGSFTGDIDLDPGAASVTTTSTGVNTDMYLVKLDADGEYMWSRHFEGSDYFIGADVAVNNYGQALIAGTFRGTADFDPGAGNLSTPSVGDWDAFIAGIDDNGDYIFHQVIGGPFYDRGYAVEVDPYQNIYTAGEFKSATIDFDASVDGVAEATAVNNNGYILRLNPDCSLISSISVEGTVLTANTDDCSYQWIDCADNMPIPGETNQTFTPSENGEYACIINDDICEDTSACITISTIGIETNKLISVKLYPNPVTTTATLELGGKLNGTEHLIIYNMLGEVVYHQSNLNTNKVILDKKDLNPGIYQVTVYNSNMNSHLVRTQLIIQ